MEILKQCVVAWCHRPLPLADLVKEMREANIQGLTIMRFAGPMVLLMFGSSDECKVSIQNLGMRRWFTRVEKWSPSISVNVRRVWLTISGMSIQAWSEGTFRNIAQLWGVFVQTDDETVEYNSFETCRVQIETNSSSHIDEIIELVIEGISFQLRIVESNQPLVVVCNCSVEDVSKAQGTESEDEIDESSGQRMGKKVGEVAMDTLGMQKEGGRGYDIQMSATDGERNVWQENQNLVDAYRHGSSRVEETLEGDIFVQNLKVPATLSSTKGEDTIIPDSLASKEFPRPFDSQHLEVYRRLDLRVEESVSKSPSWMSDEQIGMVARAEQVSDGMDIRECEYPLDHVQPINGPNENIRADKADIVRINETERKSKMQKKGRGRPRKNPPNSDGIVNGSLSDSDFLNRKRMILPEAHETLQLGKWIGVSVIGNEEEVVQDIARLIEGGIRSNSDMGHEYSAY
ncbi:hypothetical protein V6N13_043322 [Hibiscus sabdariffa]